MMLQSKVAEHHPANEIFFQINLTGTPVATKSPPVKVISTTFLLVTIN